MLIIFLLLILGGLFGVLSRKWDRLIRYVDKLTIWVIRFLLLFLGISVGSNEKIIGNITSIGINAAIISIGSVAGSVIVSWVIYRLYFLSNKQIIDRTYEK